MEDARGRAVVGGAMKLVVELKVLVVHAEPEGRHKCPLNTASDIPAVMMHSR